MVGSGALARPLVRSPTKAWEFFGKGVAGKLHLPRGPTVPATRPRTPSKFEVPSDVAIERKVTEAPMPSSSDADGGLPARVVARYPRIYDVRRESRYYRSRQPASGGAGTTPDVSVPEGLDEFLRHRLRTGIIDIGPLPADLPSGDPGGEGFAWMCFPYTRIDAPSRASWLPWSTLDQQIINGRFDPLTDSVLYPGWSGHPRSWWLLRHMQQLAYVYREFIPDRWPYGRPGDPHPYDDPRQVFVCENLSSYVAEVLTNHSRFLSMELESDCPTTGGMSQRIVRQADGSFMSIYSLDFGGDPPYRAKRTGHRVQYCPSYIEAYAYVADFFVSWGNRAYWYAADGHASDAFEALYHLVMARRCGQLALGAMMEPTRTLVHEIAHLAYRDWEFDTHCDWFCCPQGLAGWHWARLRAYLGVPNVGSEVSTGQIDSTFSVAHDFYRSECIAEGNDPGLGLNIVEWINAAFTGELQELVLQHTRSYRIDFTFGNLGVPGDPEAFQVRGETFPTAGLCDPRAIPFPEHPGLDSSTWTPPRQPPTSQDGQE